MSFNQPQQGTAFSTTSATSYTGPAPPGHLAPAGANAPFAPGIIAPPSGPIRKKPKPTSKPKPGKQLSKSLSTPQLRGPIMSDPELDKKRNKLGYQRISIACAHCRRRKIRCLVAEEDPDGRCQNCIRLKKDCVFYPVDQQNAIDARSETASKPSVPPSAPSSTVSSSPSHGDLRAFEQQSHQFGGGFHRLPSAVSTTSFQGIPIAPNNGPQPQGNYAPPDHGYPHTETPVSWSPHEFDSSNQPMTIRGAPGIPQPWVRFGAPGSAVDSAPFPGPPDQPHRTLQSVQSFPYAPEQTAQSWHPSEHHPPVRSMSVPGYGNHELHPSFQQGQQPTSPHIRQTYDPHQAADPRMVPTTPTQPGYQGPPLPYMMHPDQRSSSIPFIQQPYPPHAPQMQPGWYGEARPFTQGEEPRVSQPNSQPGNFHVGST